jgi:polyhydroxybutyrate depolymerase
MKILRVVLVLFALLASVVIAAGALFSVLNETNGEIESSGKTRKYLLYVPESYQPEVPTALVISLHGFADWPAHHKETTRWNILADEEGFIVVYPTGTGFPLRWQTRKAGEGVPLVDVVFIADLIESLSVDYNIDPARVYVNGFSNGGGMTYLLGCQLAERITAIGTVAGAYAIPPEDCQPSQPVPVIAFHGTDDQIVAFDGGEVEPVNYQLPPVIDWVEAWAARNGCETVPVAIAIEGEARGIKYTGCQQQAEIHFYTILGGGHAWPGGKALPDLIVGHTTQEIDATRVMWHFFDGDIR